MLSVASGKGSFEPSAVGAGAGEGGLGGAVEAAPVEGFAGGWDGAEASPFFATGVGRGGNAGAAGVGPVES